MLGSLVICFPFGATNVQQLHHVPKGTTEGIESLP